MHRFFSDIPFSVAVAKQKSFTQAADVLDSPLPTVSRRIAAMEKNLGIRLFNRNSRKVELTEAGRSFYESCEFIVADAKNALERLLQEQHHHTGRVRLALPATTYFMYVQGALGSFAAQYSGIELHVHFTTRWVDLYSEPYDLEIRAGALPDSDLSLRKLFTSRQGIYASPDLLRRYPLPVEPSDLAGMPNIQMPVFRDNMLELHNGEAKQAIPLQPSHVVNGMALAEELLLAGQGISALDVGIARKYEQSGQLVRLLPEWSMPGVDINLVRVTGRLPHRVQLFVDHMVAHFKNLRVS